MTWSCATNGPTVHAESALTWTPEGQGERKGKGGIDRQQGGNDCRRDEECNPRQDDLEEPR